MRRHDAPGRSAVAVIASSGVLEGVRMCRSDAEIAAALGDSAALVVIDAPIVVPAAVTGRRDMEHVLAWLDIPAFPVSGARLDKVHGGARGPGLVAALSPTAVAVEGLPDQVLRQLLWERAHPIGSPPLGLAEYRVEWQGVRAPAFRPRGGRARNDGLVPARALLADAADLRAWPAAERTGDLADLDEAAAIDAVACAITAHRVLHGAPGTWARIGSRDAGQVVIAAGPDLIHRAHVNMARLREEGTIGIPPEVAGEAVGPADSW